MLITPTSMHKKTLQYWPWPIWSFYKYCILYTMVPLKWSNKLKLACSVSYTVLVWVKLIFLQSHIIKLHIRPSKKLSKAMTEDTHTSAELHYRSVDCLVLHWFYPSVISCFSLLSMTTLQTWFLMGNKLWLEA